MPIPNTCMHIHKKKNTKKVTIQAKAGGYSGHLLWRVRRHFPGKGSRNAGCSKLSYFTPPS